MMTKLKSWLAISSKKPDTFSETRKEIAKMISDLMEEWEKHQDTTENLQFRFSQSYANLYKKLLMGCVSMSHHEDGLCYSINLPYSGEALKKNERLEAASFLGIPIIMDESLEGHTFKLEKHGESEEDMSNWPRELARQDQIKRTNYSKILSDKIDEYPYFYTDRRFGNLEFKCSKDFMEDFLSVHDMRTELMNDDWVLERYGIPIVLDETLDGHVVKLGRKDQTSL